MKPIGKKLLRHEVQIIPKQIKLLAYYAVTYTCDRCEKDTGFAHIATAKLPIPLMKHSLASPSTVAYIMTQNWLFCDTTKGAEASAIVYSMVECAKGNDVEPFAYLQHVLLQLPYLGKTHSHEEPESLMPWAPYIQQEFGMKNLMLM